MKMNGFQVEEHGSGYAVTLRLQIGKEELEYAKITIDMVRLLGAIGRSFISVAGGEEVSRDTEPGDEVPPTKAKGRRKSSAKTSNATAETDAGGGEEGKPKTRRRRGKPAGSSDTASETKGRRRRGPAASTASDETPSDDEKPKGRRRGKKAVENPTDTAPTVGASSRTRRKKTSASLAKSPSDDVSDEDLTKAASQAASVVGAPAVMDVLEEFGAAQVSDLDQEQRREFLGKLKDLDE